MKEIRAKRTEKDDWKSIRIVTRAEIEKTIFQGMAYVQKHYNGKCTIGDLLKEKEKIQKRYRTALDLPFVSVAALIVSKSVNKKIELLDDILHMYDYANNKHYGYLSDWGDQSPELLEQPVDLEKFLNPDFYKEFGRFVYNGRPFNGDYSVEEYLADEKIALEQAKEKQETKANRKSGR